MKRHLPHILFGVLLLLLTYSVFWQSLFFTFWKDDWALIWGSIYNPKLLLVYILHPGSFIEFYLFSHFFPNFPLAWNIFGILLRASSAFLFAVITYRLTESKRSGFWAGIFVAVSYFGLEAVVWPSAHVAALSLVIVLISLYFFIRWEEKKSRPLLWITTLLLAILTDPGRITPVLLLLVYLHGVYFRKPIKKLLFALLFSSIIIVPFCLWFLFLWKDSILEKTLLLAFHNPSLLFNKLYVTYNFFASIGNLVVGLIFPMGQDVQNTGVYNRVYALIGFGCFALLGFLVIQLKQKITRSKSLIIFFLLWIFLFYFPNWLFEPRSPMAGPHRYILISSLGLIGLIAYVLGKIKNPKWVIGIAILIVGLNIFHTQQILSLEKPFRQATVIQKNWQQVDREVAENKEQYTFIFSGDQPFLSQGLQLSGGAPFALMRHITQKEMIPVVTSDTDILVTRLCAKNSAHIALDTIYSWVVTNKPTLTNTTLSTRNNLKMLQKKQCP